MAMREEPLAIVLSVAINKKEEIGIAETAPSKGHRDIIGSFLCSSSIERSSSGLGTGQKLSR